MPGARSRRPQPARWRQPTDRSSAPVGDHSPTASAPQDSAICNAGRGSNLSFNGLVECDASVMTGDGAFGAVAAAPGARAMDGGACLPLPLCRLRR